MNQGTDMTPTQIMEAEHRLIETVVKALGGVAAAVELGERPAVARMATAVEFLRVYADQLHHGKEEKLFFPMLVKRGVPPQGCPIGGLNHEHEKGRALVQALAEQASVYAQGKPGAKEVLLETLRGIQDLYENHIWKEDAMVFPMADKVLTAADQTELCKKFAEVDRAIGSETIARLEQFARSLATGTGPTFQAGGSPTSGCGCGGG
ncbi:MAG TPA: hemerythrin domain-containing protein [Candidatus Paceibacterota bacterium]|nr:hemerythrin domain-containing protein [Verrucomicrobiota bacterium]HOX02377.1 hemerythrin domain-containing protein [Verrucomicrobiota bacterium]HRZ45131.1 hemerythrin domain-containing protein [Candidatus Paceibacterota bacterium]HRZ92197.1 hemerythrin domain-containing protein [Candidatus Paceibacterota bacterium]